MKLIVDSSSKRNISKLYIEKIIQMIEGHELKIGSKMPSIRLFAESNKLSFKTVVRIYDVLTDQKYLHKIHGKGTYVKAYIQAVEVKDHKLKPLVSRTRFIRNLENDTGVYKYHFVDTHQSQYLVPYEFINQLKNDIDRSMLSHYSDPKGSQILLAKLHTHFVQEKIDMSSNETLIVNGVQQAINIIARTYMSTGDGVGMARLSFPAAADVFNWQGASVYSIEIDHYGLDTVALELLLQEKSIKFLYVMPNFNNPTGILMSPERRVRLLALAVQYDFYIIEDDSWGELYLGKDKPLSLKSQDDYNRVIYLKGFTKTIGAGYRIGAIVAEKSMIDSLTISKTLSDLGSPIMTQNALSCILGSDYYKNSLKTMRVDLKNRMVKVRHILDEHLPQNAHYINPDGGPNVWIELPERVDASRLLEFAHEKGLNFGVGHVYFTNALKKNRVRLSIINIELELLAVGVKLFCNILEKYITVIPNN